MNSKSLFNLADVDFACYRASEKCVFVRWKTKNSSKSKRSFMKSPEFKFLDSYWEISIKTGAEVGAYIHRKTLHLYIHSTITEKEKKFSILFAIKNNKGEVLKSFAMKNETLKEGKDHGLIKYYFKLDDFSDRKLYEVLHNDSFIVHFEICELHVVVEELKVSSSAASKTLFKTDDSAEYLRTALESGKHSDVELKLGDVALPAHKLILSMRSEVFRAMFDSDMKENNLSCVELVEMSPDVAKIMLHYIYRESLEEINKNNMLDLYEAAEKYLLLTMKTMCRDFILENLTVDNVCDIAVFADLHSDDLLKEASDEFLSWNIKNVVETEGWNALSATNFQFFLSLMKRAILINPYVL